MNSHCRCNQREKILLVISQRLSPFSPVYTHSFFAKSCHSLLDECVNCSVVSQLLVTPWLGAHQAPLSMEVSMQEYWNGLPFPSPGDLPDPGIEPGTPALWTDSLPSEPLSML